MSFPRYDRYKASGVEWLGEVPDGWEIIPVRAMVIEQTAKNEGGENQEYLSLMANVGIIPYEEKGDVGNKKPEDLSKCKLVAVGDLVINSMNYGIGSYGLSPLSGVCSPVYVVLTPILTRVESRFAFRIFENRGFQRYAQSFGNGILEHRAAINWDILKVIPIALPSRPEQQQILTFLDRETAKIDALVAEQENLIGLLKEKRQAVISHAVTKGLDPNAPMKDSGVEWLGEVPKEWEVKRLKFAVSMIVDCPHETPRYSEEGGYMVIRTADIESGRISSRNMYRVDDDEYQNRVRRATLLEGDIVYSREGERWGHAAMVPKGQTFCLGQRMMQFRFAESSPAYSMWQLNSENIYRQGQLDIVGATSPHVNVSTIRNYVLANPPLVEQAQIAFLLDTETAKLDELTAEAERSIELLKERRFALISAAVTGKIDVRNAA